MCSAWTIEVDTVFEEVTGIGTQIFITVSSLLQMYL